MCFSKKSPLLFGVKVIKGKIYNGITLICNEKNIGKVIGIRLNDHDVSDASKNQEICIKIHNPSKYEYDNDFTAENIITNYISNDDNIIRCTYNIT